MREGTMAPWTYIALCMWTCPSRYEARHASLEPHILKNERRIRYCAAILIKVRVLVVVEEVNDTLAFLVLDKEQPVPSRIHRFRSADSAAQVT